MHVKWVNQLMLLHVVASRGRVQMEIVGHVLRVHCTVVRMHLLLLQLSLLSLLLLVLLNVLWGAIVRTFGSGVNVLTVSGRVKV